MCVRVAVMKERVKAKRDRGKHYCDDETITAAAETIEDTRHIVCLVWCLLQRVINSSYNHNPAAKEKYYVYITHRHTHMYVYINARGNGIGISMRCGLMTSTTLMIIVVVTTIIIKHTPPLACDRARAPKSVTNR